MSAVLNDCNMAALNGGGEANAGLRRRRIADRNERVGIGARDVLIKDKIVKDSTEIKTGTFWLTRIVFLRSLGFIYGVAFLVALHQNKQLLGQKGLLPVSLFLSQVKEHSGGLNFQAVVHVPSLLWLVSPEDIDFYLDIIACLGFGISVAIFISGAANAFAMVSLWILYHSIVNVGQRWYSFGWESQLLETGFLAIFFCPVWTWKQLPKDTPPSTIVIWGYRWLLFRIMLGAGLIKIRGDKCWRNLTCMNYHYETQPIPNFLSYYLHHLPELYHKFETLSNHFVELVVPWFAFLTRKFRITFGVVQIMFQVALIVSGNLSFLNWLTILPSIAFFDDCTLAFLFSKKSGALKWQVSQLQHSEKEKQITSGKVRRIVNLSLGLSIAYLSIPVIVNLMSPHQRMNTSFEPLRIVNTYGAFGSITKKRTEIILQGTNDDPSSGEAVWKEYEFKCKPGNITKQPCWISPYHYRLDWLMWFAAFQTYEYNPWLVHLAAKLLMNDEGAISLIDYNPFQEQPPKFVRAEHYRYSFSKIDSTEAKNGQWWVRKYIGNYMPPVSIHSLKPIMTRFGWNT